MCQQENYKELLNKLGGIKKNYTDYMTTEPLDCNAELERIDSADFDLCCVVLTLFLREEHFSQNGCFNNRCNNGDVQRIIDRMIVVLENRESEIKRRLQGRTSEYFMFLDD